MAKIQNIQKFFGEDSFPGQYVKFSLNKENASYPYKVTSYKSDKTIHKQENVKIIKMDNETIIVSNNKGQNQLFSLNKLMTEKDFDYNDSAIEPTTTQQIETFANSGKPFRLITNHVKELALHAKQLGTVDICSDPYLLSSLAKNFVDSMNSFLKLAPENRNVNDLKHLFLKQVYNSVLTTNKIALWNAIDTDQSGTLIVRLAAVGAMLKLIAEKSDSDIMNVQKAEVISGQTVIDVKNAASDTGSICTNYNNANIPVNKDYAKAAALAGDFIKLACYAYNNHPIKSDLVVFLDPLFIEIGKPADAYNAVFFGIRFTNGASSDENQISKKLFLSAESAIAFYNATSEDIALEKLKNVLDQIDVDSALGSFMKGMVSLFKNDHKAMLANIVAGYNKAKNEQKTSDCDDNGTEDKKDVLCFRDLLLQKTQSDYSTLQESQMEGNALQAIVEMSEFLAKKDCTSNTFQSVTIAKLFDTKLTGHRVELKKIDNTKYTITASLGNEETTSYQISPVAVDYNNAIFKSSAADKSEEKFLVISFQKEKLVNQPTYVKSLDNKEIYSDQIDHYSLCGSTEYTQFWLLDLVIGQGQMASVV